MYFLGEGTFFKDGNGARATFFTKSDWGRGNTFYAEKMGGGHQKLRVFLGGVPVNFGHSLRKIKPVLLNPEQKVFWGGKKQVGCGIYSEIWT